MAQSGRVPAGKPETGARLSLPGRGTMARASALLRPQSPSLRAPAKQSRVPQATLECFGASRLAMTLMPASDSDLKQQWVTTCACSLAARSAPEIWVHSHPPQHRGHREGRALAAPVARLQKGKQAAVTTGLAEHARPSLRDGVNAYTCSPRGPALLPPSSAMMPQHHRETWHQHRDARTTRFHVRVMPFVGVRNTRCGLAASTAFRCQRP